MFTPGQEVVCIRDEWALSHVERGPRKGLIYVVTETHFLPSGTVVNASARGIVTTREDMLFLRLQGFRCYYAAKCFRPVRKTDISIFTAMLDKVPA